MKKRICCGLAAFACLITALFLSGCALSGAGVTSACTGYSAALQGEENAAGKNWHEDEVFTPPGEFLTALAALVGAQNGCSEELLYRIVYDPDPVYFASLVRECAGDAPAFLEKMQAAAAACGMTRSTVGSITGGKKEEHALNARLDGTGTFSDSFMTLADARALANALAKNERTRLLYGVDRRSFPETDTIYTRNAPLLRETSDLYCPEVTLCLSGNAIDARGRTVCALLVCYESAGKTASSAVTAYTGSDDALSYACCDGANLCGALTGSDPALTYLPAKTDPGAGVLLGGSIYAGLILVFAGLALLTLLGAIAAGVILRMKRNAEGRKKYRS